MLYRSHRWAVRVGIVLVGLAIAAYSPGSIPAARAADPSIRFEDLDAYAHSRGPRARILAERLAGVVAEKDAALRWSNPEVAYDREEIDPNPEWQVTLRKGFETPFSYAKKRRAWKERVRAAELEFDQEVTDFLAELKAGYVRVQLLDTYLSRLTRLEEILKTASDVAAARHGEGEMSGVDRRLIHLSILALDASRRDAREERDAVAGRWAAEIGLPPGTDAVLATPIAYRPVALDPPDTYISILERRPGLRSRTVLGEALGQQADAAKPSLVPGLDVYVGYKEIDPALDGWVAGAALSLPLFHWRAGEARRLEAERRIAEHDLEIYRTRSAAAVRSLVGLIEDAQDGLSSIEFPAENGPSVIGALLLSYQDGRYSLEAFLNAVQIEVTGSRSYYDQLYRYYENIFRLEAFTGAEIVTFSSEDGEGQ